MNAKQEILDALKSTILSQRSARVYDQAEARTSAVLATHELVPVDARPFDPTLCGFRSLEPHSEGLWENATCQIVKCSRGFISVFTDKYDGTMSIDCPWPETQSDGETLLRLLGVLEP